MKTLKSLRTKGLVGAVALAFGMAMGFGPAAMAAGTVNVGLSSALTGPVAALGVANEHGVQMAIEALNAKGGLLGKQIKLLTADGELKPATGVRNVRNFVLSDHVKAIFGPVASSVGAAEVQAAGQYHVPIFINVSNDIDHTGKYFNKYVFQIVPSTYMEPHAVAYYVAQRMKSHGWKTFATISPNYSFGHDSVKTFLAAMKQYGAKVDVISKQWPKLGSSDFTQYISAMMSKKPDFVLNDLYGGDLITFTKQAVGYGMFKKTQASGFYLTSVLAALGKEAPAGVIVWDRAPPFYLHPTKDMQQFTKAFHAKYNKWPSTWAILGYTAVETWAAGVKKAGSFDADKVSAALSGATVKTVRGSFKIRACDHLAEIPEYTGVLSKKVNPKYGMRTMTDVVTAPSDKIMLSCKAKEAMRQ